MKDQEIKVGDLCTGARERPAFQRDWHLRYPICVFLGWNSNKSEFNLLILETEGAWVRTIYNPKIFQIVKLPR
jgi:hypothetical protein